MFQPKAPLLATTRIGGRAAAPGTIRLASRGLARIAGLEALLGTPCRFGARPSPEDAAVAGWGRKPSGNRARDWAERAGLPWLLLEDGFLRSVGRNEAPLSVVVDDLGIHYDAAQPSRLEALIAAPASPDMLARGYALAASWRNGRVSKYNGFREWDGNLPERYVLIADQARGDCSVRFGRAGDATFAAMLEAALDENPGCTVLVKRHPDSLARGSAGHYGGLARGAEARLRLLDGACHPARLLEGCEAVYVATSLIGFEALIWGKRVRCFGMPFYAGWGLTEDALPAPARRGRASLDRLVHAALAAYPSYLDPETGEPCAPERVIEHLALQRRMRERFPARVHALGFSRWKRPILRRFLAGSTVSFGRQGSAPRGAALATWGMAGAGKAAPAILRVEDGFLRSVGLGAALVEPLSWVQDDLGLHYDPSSPSRLEVLLAEGTFDPALLARAKSLRERIVARQITKYNVGARPWARPSAVERVVLVVGQVESDASLARGAPGIRTNRALLRAVRAHRPDAHLVFKPHPDVVAGLRDGRAEPGLPCEEVVVDVPPDSLLAGVDEVHTLTSLLGFEALLRGVPVTCHGQPFYAGWGLTTDLLPLPRRRRRLSLDELVAAALILYPAYVSRTTGHFTTPERALVEIEQARATPPRAGVALRRAAARMVVRQMRRIRTVLENKANG